MSDTPHTVHFIAIAGSGMGALAGLLKARGMSVSGSDDKLYPPMSTLLEGWGIPVREGFRAENVLEAEPDLVIIGNAVRPENPEARAAIDEGLPYRSFSDALYELAIAGKHPVVVSGTHGKTTTTSLIGFLLHATARDPSMLVGGHAVDFGGSFCEGSGEHFVVEGDEYDTAFFDKTPKFLHYHPRTLVITSVEFDHADIYRDLDHVKEAFRTLVSRMPSEGTIVAALDHEGVRDVVRDAPCPVVGYRIGEGELGWCATSVRAESEGMHFDLQRDGGAVASVRTSMHGLFNVENNLAAIATLAVLGVPVEETLAALPRFHGVKRRLEVRGVADGVTILDDFAHHPTAVAGSIAAARDRFPDGRLIAVFEPRTNTSRRKIFQQRYAEVFDRADVAVLRVVPDMPIYSATGEVTERFSAHELAAALVERKVAAVAIDGIESIVSHVCDEARPGDVVLVMSNGDFDGIWEKLLDALRARA